MDDQVTPTQFIVFLFALGMSGVLVSFYWYWVFETGPVAWARSTMHIVTVSYTHLRAHETL